ncbi:unnamed protein product, partial [Pleuronectes platessa]
EVEPGCEPEVAPVVNGEYGPNGTEMIGALFGSVAQIWQQEPSVQVSHGGGGATLPDSTDVTVVSTFVKRLRSDAPVVCQGSSHPLVDEAETGSEMISPAQNHSVFILLDMMNDSCCKLSSLWCPPWSLTCSEDAVTHCLYRGWGGALLRAAPRLNSSCTALGRGGGCEPREVVLSGTLKSAPAQEVFSTLCHHFISALRGICSSPRGGSWCLAAGQWKIFSSINTDLVRISRPFRVLDSEERCVEQEEQEQQEEQEKEKEQQEEQEKEQEQQCLLSPSGSV